jgi:hypothetical protein
MARLQQCTKTHQSCGFANKKPLPTRVIDVSTHVKDVRLYETQNESDYYVSLSHCWGKARAITTTSETLVKNSQIITWDCLPKTFQDAVTIVRRLGLKYLWIDSLCIIQDDPEDWSRESGKMVAVYQNAYLTIAATKSADDDGGCFSMASPKHLSRKLGKFGDKAVQSRAYARARILLQKAVRLRRSRGSI